MFHCPREQNIEIEHVTYMCLSVGYRRGTQPENIAMLFVQEIMVDPGLALSDEEKRRVISWLNEKWGFKDK